MTTLRKRGNENNNSYFGRVYDHIFSTGKEEDTLTGDIPLTATNQKRHHRRQLLHGQSLFSSISPRSCQDAGVGVKYNNGAQVQHVYDGGGGGSQDNSERPGHEHGSQQVSPSVSMERGVNSAHDVSSSLVEELCQCEVVSDTVPAIALLSLFPLLVLLCWWIQ
mgnify:CR=1 FL=1|tara:strand:+ start:288 stop:779 length:492 start_codon:yes stop_codon:yes gene_type:complete